ncbi:M3 family metallopeptidase [Paraburkholderia humisilvae]|uniref:Dipeptidyl carboxypeptidase n=1 Tax=Paraburkholderia humisilvae TaxID=627669 RepID=A0A6J5DCC3_9BURK|nr:M3 family metallopeptidase [Paraburkholderia humisilvae]CAB3751898.1 Dipeptidyl carboxypeptidase [Paraburkholderia humisilvae]
MTEPANPLLQDWQTRYQLPPFAQIRAEHFAPAFAVLFDRHLAEIDALATHPQAPTFDNTVAAFDAAGADLDRVRLTFENLCASEAPPELQAVEREMAPRLAAHDSKVAMHAGFFARLDAVARQAPTLPLSEEQQRLLARIHTDFVRTGAALQGVARERFTAIAVQLANLQTQFAQNVLADESAYQLRLMSDADLAGLPEFLRAAARGAARERDVDGYVITLARSLVQPFLTFSARRDLRETAWRAWTTRGETAGRDNRPIAREILALRAEQARLLGYESFADYALSDRMAGHARAVYALLDQVWEPAKASVARERAALVEQATALGEPTDIEPWDWYYLAEKVRIARYALDDAEIKPYFSLDAMVNAMFDCAERLFGVQFIEQTGIALYHPDVRIWEVQRGGAPVGVFLADNYARPNKQGGAWMHIYRRQTRNGRGSDRRIDNHTDGDSRPIVVNNNNFARNSDGPTLLSFDDVRTLFHEFGHGLHGLLSDVTYGRLSGTHVPQDYVELPSQLMENWATVAEVLSKHARHVDTGAPIPAALIERIRASQTFNQGFETVSYASSALIDMALHLQKEADSIDIARFEAQQRERLGVPREVGMRHRLPHFSHIFSGAHYAAGYYVYMWAEVLEAEAFEAFEEAGDPFDPALADKLKRYVYSAGDSRDERAAFREFRGRDPQAAPMLRKRGLLAA